MKMIISKKEVKYLWMLLQKLHLFENNWFKLTKNWNCFWFITFAYNEKTWLSLNFLKHWTNMIVFVDTNMFESASVLIFFQQGTATANAPNDLGIVCFNLLIKFIIMAKPWQQTDRTLEMLYLSSRLKIFQGLVVFQNLWKIKMQTYDK